MTRKKSFSFCVLCSLLVVFWAAAGVFAPLEWLASLGQPDPKQTVERKKAVAFGIANLKCCDQTRCDEHHYGRDVER